MENTKKEEVQSAEKGGSFSILGADIYASGVGGENAGGRGKVTEGWRHPERKTKKIVPPEQQQTTFRLILAAPLRRRRLEEELAKVPDSSDRSTVRFFFHWSTILFPSEAVHDPDVRCISGHFRDPLNRRTDPARVRSGPAVEVAEVSSDWTNLHVLHLFTCPSDVEEDRDTASRLAAVAI